MLGALGSHLYTPLGIVVEWDGNSDHGQLFIMAIITFIFSLTSIILYCKIRKCSISQLIAQELFKN